MKRWFHVCPACHKVAQNEENRPYYKSHGNKSATFGKCQWCGHTSTTRRFKLERVIKATEKTVKLTAFDCKDYLIAWHWSILRSGVYETSNGIEILPKADRLTNFGIEKFGITTEKYTIIRWR